MAKIRHNLEMKRFCPDFRPVRSVLRSIGAEPMGVRRQTDTYFKMPFRPDGSSQRIKARRERRRTTMIWYSDSYADGVRNVEYVIASIDGSLITLLAKALGVSAIVRKSREQWQLPGVLFNLDTVDGIGRIAEIEVIAEATADPYGTFRRLGDQLDPYLGEYIEASNVDLAEE
jgi:adenylate cyclase class IV